MSIVCSSAVIPVSQFPLQAKWGKDTAYLGFPWSELGGRGSGALKTHQGRVNCTEVSPHLGRVNWVSGTQYYLHIRVGITWGWTCSRGRLTQEIEEGRWWNRYGRRRCYREEQRKRTRGGNGHSLPSREGHAGAESRPGWPEGARQDRGPPAELEYQTK